jgi:hypothetical protein
MEDKSLNDLFASLTPEQRLMAVMSEMLTPLEIIRGYAALIKKQANNTDNQELVEYTEEIEKAAERLKMLRNAIS